MTRQKTMSDQQYHDLRFSDWIRERCPSSATGWTCSDVDYVVHQYKSKHLVLLEVKRWRTGPSQGKVQTAQRHILRMLHSCLSLGMRELFPSTHTMASGLSSLTALGLMTGCVGLRMTIALTLCL